ncbi:MAG TPA: indolepyruvate ferredoxin oxidoreductase subunit alpha [Candidatus Methylomirabilis sp.]|nr:indolepyruvate ferredoxin oxidoreductase subunit alpha [Candidatus Methylomirabilis sp.]
MASDHAVRVPATSGRLLMSGNEAVARGAWEAGVSVASSYPGTPATEILEALARYPDVYAEWAPNEKVAFEVAMGASLAGARSMVAMKHVGLNVAADPLMSGSYIGVHGGFLIAVSDDVGMASSQNGQDTRYFARFAKVPLLEPSDSHEAKTFVAEALDLSEQHDTPVILRLTTRISHVKGLVDLCQRPAARFLGFAKNPAKYVVLPAHARKRHPIVLQRMKDLALLAGASPLNRLEWGTRDIGIIASGPAYMYAREAFPDASFLKLGFSFPLPEQLIREFAAQVERLYVIEELEGLVEADILAMGIRVDSREKLPRIGELTPQRLRQALVGPAPKEASPAAVSAPPDLERQPFPRPPTLCAGCPHMGVFYTLGKMKDLVITGDIGCYTLGAGFPWNAIQTCVCMGASLGNALGIEKAYRMANQGIKVVAVIGDSTFLHSGMTGLLDIVYNGGNVTVVILDNRTVGMTGGQDHPGTGVTLQQASVKPVDFVALCKALGVEHVQLIDPYRLPEVYRALKEAVAHDGPSVIVTNRPCVLIEEFHRTQPFEVVDAQCTGCGACLKTGCPAIQVIRREVVTLSNGRERQLSYVTIDPVGCNGCELCVQTCGPKAIVPVGSPAGAIGMTGSQS